ncbi:hypothetical protein [Chondrinema litorale]|uniref:hypothetical protein n=1 Tax=Chondrinema litorale TaxID=2994555 RepID=UPI002543A8D5|nr:hypothetical protein [Chondrinema litorale]UZR92323.1 hypothetical protein OQ292_10665 [Chondrinema litorale]
MLEITSEEPNLSFSYSFNENILYSEFSGILTSSLLGKLIENFSWYNKIYQPETICLNLSKSVFRIDLEEGKNYLKNVEVSEGIALKAIIVVCPDEIFSQMIYNTLNNELDEQIKEKLKSVKRIDSFIDARNWLIQKQTTFSDQSVVSCTPKTSLI